MQVAGEIQSATNNIKYYAQKIKDLVKQQFEADCKQGQKSGINTEPGSMRFECLGAITGACNYIDLCCTNIGINLVSAEKLEEKLFAEVQEENDEIEA
jgi:hypothetical protein